MPWSRASASGVARSRNHRSPSAALDHVDDLRTERQSLRMVTSMGTRVARVVARRGGYSSAASAVSAISRVIGAASAFSARGRVYGKEKVYGSIP